MVRSSRVDAVGTPQSVYWRRRLVALGVFALVVIFIVGVASGGEDEGSSQTAPPAAAPEIPGEPPIDDRDRRDRDRDDSSAGGAAGGGAGPTWIPGPGGCESAPGAVVEAA